ncbi:MAG: hypothetical protein RL115_1507, partial [Bacteroidota bacterium]
MRYFRSHHKTTMKHKLVLLVALIFVSLNSIYAQPKYEFRGVWVATVDNIDWPSHGNWDSEA